MSDNPLWDVIQAYMDDPKHRYPPKPADLARETGISEQVLSKWKARPALPSPISLLAFAQGTGIDYEVLLQAALEGKRYLPGIGRVRVNRKVMRKLVARRDWSIEVGKGGPVELVDLWDGVDEDRDARIGRLRDEISVLRHELEQAMSDPSTTTGDPIAAHEDGSIGGEQVDRNDT